MQSHLHQANCEASGRNAATWGQEPSAGHNSYKEEADCQQPCACSHEHKCVQCTRTEAQSQHKVCSAVAKSSQCKAVGAGQYVGHRGAP